LDEQFRVADKDKDGKISFDEFSGKKTMTERAFQIMDRDGNGTISKVKTCKALQSSRTLLFSITGRVCQGLSIPNARAS